MRSLLLAMTVLFSSVSAWSTGEATPIRVEIFFNTQCGYCAKLLPHLLSLTLDHANQDVRWHAYAVFEEDGGVPPQEYLDRHGYPFQLIEPGEARAESVGVFTTPEVLVFDRNESLQFQLTRHLNAAHQAVDREGLSGEARVDHLAALWAHLVRQSLARLVDSTPDRRP